MKEATAHVLLAYIGDVRRNLDVMEARIKAEVKGYPDTVPSGETAPPKKTKSEEAPLKVGDRVKITIRDKYQGRTGVLTAKRGRMFWWILLDETPTKAAKAIYKMQTSFVIVAT
jgi:hypothetical protein